MKDDADPVETKKKPCYTLYGWWKSGVPPTWMVITGALVVQVFTINNVGTKETVTASKASSMHLNDFWSMPMCRSRLWYRVHWMTDL